MTDGPRRFARRPRQRRVAVVAGVLAIASVPLASAGIGHPGNKIGEAKEKGPFVVAVVSGDARQPRQLFLKVRSRPHQDAIGNYNVVCANASADAGAAEQRDVHGRTPFIRKLRMPYPDPRSCSVVGAAQLQGGGFLTIQLFARR